MKKLNPIYLTGVEAIKKSGVLGGIVYITRLTSIDEKQKLFKASTKPGEEEIYFRLTSDLLKAHDIIKGTYNLCLCRVIDLDFDNRKYEVIVFDSINETNEFLEIEKEYGVLTQDEKYIYVARNKDRGQVI